MSKCVQISIVVSLYLSDAQNLRLFTDYLNIEKGHLPLYFAFNSKRHGRMAEIKELSFLADALMELKQTETATQRCCQEKVFWKYAANLQENTHA